MTSDELDTLINRLESIMPDDPGFVGLAVRRQDWRPFWDLAKEIQQCFNAGVRYPTKELRQAAWTRFNSFRDEASRRANSEHGHLSARSRQHRNTIFGECGGIGWSVVMDAVLFDPTTVEQMKSRGRYLANVMKYFHEHKNEMLGEDKKACHERIQEIKEEHDRFWKQYGESKAAHRSERKVRLRANIEKNRETRRKTAGFLERLRDEVSDLREKIASSTRSKWTKIWSGWLSEKESKIDDVETQLRRIDDWIEEDERKLRELGD